MPTTVPLPKRSWAMRIPILSASSFSRTAAEVARGALPVPADAEEVRGGVTRLKPEGGVGGATRVGSGGDQGLRS